MHSAPEARRARAAIGTLNEGALHAQLKDWYRRPGDRVEQLIDGFVVDLVRGGPNGGYTYLPDIEINLPYYACHRQTP